MQGLAVPGSNYMGAGRYCTSGQYFGGYLSKLGNESSSPKEDNNKTWAKVYGAKIIYMSAWSWDELEVAKLVNTIYLILHIRYYSI